MAQNITTLNEIRENNPQEAIPALTDLLYMVHGTGGDRDRAYTLEEVRDLLQTVFTMLTLTKNGVTTTIDGEGVNVGNSVKLKNDGLTVNDYIKLLSSGLSIGASGRAEIVKVLYNKLSVITENQNNEAAYGVELDANGILKLICSYVIDGATYKNILRIEDSGSNIWCFYKDESGSSYASLVANEVYADSTLTAKTKLNIGGTNGAELEWNSSSSFLKLDKLLFAQQNIRVSDGGAGYYSDISPKRITYNHLRGTSYTEIKVFEIEIDDNNCFIVKIAQNGTAQITAAEISTAEIETLGVKELVLQNNNSVFYATQSGSLDSMSSLIKREGKKITIINTSSSSITLSWSGANGTRSVSLDSDRCIDFVCHNNKWYGGQT